MIVYLHNDYDIHVVASCNDRDECEKSSDELWLDVRHYHNCGESETICLKFHPHDSQIRKISKTNGINGSGRQEILNLIDSSKIICHNCWIKLDNDLIELI